MLDIINRSDQPSWQTPLRYPQGPSLSIYFPFLAFTLISSSITNIQDSCEPFSRESEPMDWQPMDCHDRIVDTSKPQPEVWAMHSAPPAAGGKWGMVCETSAGPGVLLLSRSVAFCAPRVKFNLPKVLVYGCAPHCLCGHSHGAGAGFSGGLDQLVCGCRYVIFLRGSWEACSLISTAGDSGTTAHVSYKDPAPP